MLGKYLKQISAVLFGNEVSEENLIEYLELYTSATEYGNKKEADHQTNKVLDGLYKFKKETVSIELVETLLKALQTTLDHNTWDNHMKTVLKPYAVEFFENLPAEEQETLRPLAQELGIPLN